jgi:hypothetical protein
MTQLESRNRAFLRDLFAGPFRGHAVIMSPEGVKPDGLGDFTVSGRPVSEWVPGALANYEAKAKYLETLGDDSVPYVGLNTNTGVFAAAFGCPLHVYEEETNAVALPAVSTAEEADRLPEPSLDSPALARVLELGRLVREELGPEVPIGVPDVQSPFDVAALVWRKEEMFVALHENPEAVKRLVGKCLRLIERFLDEFKRELAETNLCHCPYAWAPPELGMWLSEDEVGSLSPAMFDEFCLPPLVELSEKFGGLFMHCCAAADHQYPGFARIPNLRGLNRVFQEPGPRPAIEAFSGKTVLIVAWTEEEKVAELLDMALPDTRFLFNMPGMPLEEAKAVHERLRERCPRR